MQKEEIRSVIFISDSHDSEHHAERVRGLGDSLILDGCDVRIDVYKESDEDWPTWMTQHFFHHFWDRFIVLLAFEQADGKSPQSGDIFRPKTGTDLATIFVIIPVDDVVTAFYTPVPPIVAKNLFRACLICGDAGDAIDDFLRSF